MSRQVKKIATVRSYQELMSVLRARAEELEMTREIMDVAGGFPMGYSGNLLAPNTIKNMGRVSFGAALRVLRLALVVVEDKDVNPLHYSLVTKRRRPPQRSRARNVPTPVKRKDATA